MSDLADSMGNLTVINATPFIWHRVLDQSYQMVSWDFPETINPGTMVSIPVDFDLLGTVTDDSAQINYTVTNQDNFQIRAKVNTGASGSDLLVNYGQISTVGNPLDTTIDLGFWAYNEDTFILSGASSSSFSSTKPPPNWMEQNLPTIGCQPLRQLCMPASHDAGMSQMNGNTVASNDADTLTQDTDIAGQLAAGFRYFDIRPVIHDGAFYTGHYSEILGSWQGGNGQSIASIITELNAFLSSHRELVILDLSHAYDTDSGYTTLTAAQTLTLITQLQGISHLFAAPSGTTDLSLLPLNAFIANNPAVLIIFDDPSTLSPPSTLPTGFYPNAQFSVYNSYANTADLNTMTNDQLTKLHTQRPTPSSPLFLLSWTLTALDPLLAAPAAHAALFQRLWPALTRQSFPNFIMLDAIGDRDNLANGNVAALSMAVNHYFNDACPA